MTPQRKTRPRPTTPLRAAAMAALLATLAFAAVDPAAAEATRDGAGSAGSAPPPSTLAMPPAPTDGDGDGQPNQIVHFVTYDGSPQPIPDGAAQEAGVAHPGAPLTITLSGGPSGRIDALEVGLYLTHTFVGDLQVDLAHGPTTVSLLDRPGLPTENLEYGCGGDDVDAVFDDDALALGDNACSPDAPAVGGFLAPVGSLAAFDHHDLSGDWTFTIRDVALQDVGTFQFAGLFAHVRHDCNDGNAAVYPGAPEAADGLDNDCDGSVDEGASADTDGDGVQDAADNCPAKPNATQKDTDGDGHGDACDPDVDGDGVRNAADNCRAAPNPLQADWDDDGAGDACDDADGDRVVDALDNCRTTPNRTQADSDGDGIGNPCEDTDADGVLDPVDNCRLVPNPGQHNYNHPGQSTWTPTDNVGDACDDTDGDRVKDDADNCLFAPNRTQADKDGDGIGNPCDGTPNGDDDSDSVDNAVDNCRLVPNSGQHNADDDARGDACDRFPDDPTRV